MDLSCPGCGVEYDTIEREPQNLSCGCDLCLFCVEERRGTGRCPEGHDVDWNRVTVSRRVLKMVHAAQFSCNTHKGRPYDFWCPTCRVPLCGICAVSHKDVCLRAASGGVGSSNPSFYLIEMSNPSASEDLIRFAQEHSKAIEQTATDLEDSIPACLLKQPDEFAEFVQNKALEAVQHFYHNLEKAVGELWERYNKEREAALREEEKRDNAVLRLTETKGHIDMAVMELNVAVKSFRDAERDEKKAKDQEQQQQVQQLQQSQQQQQSRAGQLDQQQQQQIQQQQSHEKSKVKGLASADMCSKAGQLASIIQKLIDEHTSGDLKGSVSCSHIRHLAELKVLSLDPLHPQWTTADPPPRSCPLYRGTIRARGAGASAFSGSGVGGGSGTGEIFSSSALYNNANSGSSSHYPLLQPSSDISGVAYLNQYQPQQHQQTSVSRLSGPRVGVVPVITSSSSSSSSSASVSAYEARDASPNSQRRPRLMESLWREQIRQEASSASYSPPSSRLTQSSNGPMMSPGGNRSSVGRY